MCTKHRYKNVYKSTIQNSPKLKAVDWVNNLQYIYTKAGRINYNYTHKNIWMNLSVITNLTGCPNGQVEMGKYLKTKEKTQRWHRRHENLLGLTYRESGSSWLVAHHCPGQGGNCLCGVSRQGLCVCQKGHEIHDYTMCFVRRKKTFIRGVCFLSQ